MRTKCIIYLLSVVLLCSCKFGQRNNKEIVLKIGKLEVTRYEFESDKKRALQTMKTDSGALKKKAILSKWKSDYMDRCYIIALAYDRGYDTIERIRKQERYFGDYMMAVKEGWLWKKIVTPEIEKAKKLTGDKLTKRKWVYYFDCIQSEQRDSLLSLTGNGTSITDKEEFARIKKSCTSKKWLSSQYFSARWPFYPFWGDDPDNIYKMQAGKVSKLLRYGSSYSFLFLDRKEEVPIDDKDKITLQNELAEEMSNYMITKVYGEIDKACQPVVNQSSIDEILKFMASGKPFESFGRDIELIRYKLENKVKSIHYKTYLEYYNFQPILTPIKDRDQLVQHVKNFCIDDYFVNESKKLGLYETEDYLLGQQCFLHSELYGEYLLGEIGSKIKIDSAEIKTYYQNHQKVFEQTKYIIADLYAFVDFDKAMINQEKLFNKIHNGQKIQYADSLDLKGLTKIYSSVIFDMESSKLNKDVREALLGLKYYPNYHMPVLYKMNYALINITKEEGKFVTPFAEVSKMINDKLVYERSDKARLALLKDLKKKYKVEIDKTGL